MTATLAVLALKWTGLPVYWEGRLIAIPTGTFEVAEACSGVRYLIACVAVGSLFAYLMYSSFWRRLAFMGLSLVVPLAANAARAYGIIMISHLSNNRLAHGIDHVIYGWIFFGVVMMLLFWIGSLFRDAKASDSGIADYDPHVYQPRVLFGWTAAIAMIALSAPLMAAWYDRPVAVTEFVPALPAGENGWVGPREISEKMRPVFHGASAERCGEYVLDAKSVNVCIVYYAIERQDAELVSSENRVFDHKLWLQTASRSLEIRAPNQPALSVEELMLQSGAERRLLWYWYNVNGVNTISDVMAKIHALRARLLRDASGSSAIILSTELEIEPTAARDTIKAFLDGMLDPIHASLKPAAS
jgi:EpsI family protein